eukprot:scaffold425_cov175-Amphora_coffeaeformis.AAC.52
MRRNRLLSISRGARCAVPCDVDIAGQNDGQACVVVVVTRLKNNACVALDGLGRRTHHGPSLIFAV